MHYAAKNNATQSLKVMLRLGGRINDRDYKRRTPLFVSAETGKWLYVVVVVVVVRVFYIRRPLGFTQRPLVFYTEILGFYPGNLGLYPATLGFYPKHIEKGIVCFFHFH